MCEGLFFFPFHHLVCFHLTFFPQLYFHFLSRSRIIFSSSTPHFRLLLPPSEPPSFPLSFPGFLLVLFPSLLPIEMDDDRALPADEKRRRCRACLLDESDRHKAGVGWCFVLAFLPFLLNLLPA